MTRRSFYVSCVSVAVLLAGAACATRVSGGRPPKMDLDALPTVETAWSLVERPPVAALPARPSAEREPVVEEMISSIPPGRVSGGPLPVLVTTTPPSGTRRPPLLIREAPPGRPKPLLVIPSLAGGEAR